MTEFFHQGGYAFFIWGAYGMCALLLTAEILQIRSQQRTIWTRLGRLIRIREIETKTGDFGAQE